VDTYIDLLSSSVHLVSSGSEAVRASTGTYDIVVDKCDMRLDLWDSIWAGLYMPITIMMFGACAATSGLGAGDGLTEQPIRTC
jgi:hypothetical protein